MDCPRHSKGPTQDGVGVESCVQVVTHTRRCLILLIPTVVCRADTVQFQKCKHSTIWNKSQLTVKEVAHSTKVKDKVIMHFAHLHSTQYTTWISGPICLTLVCWWKIEQMHHFLLKKVNAMWNEHSWATQSPQIAPTAYSDPPTNALSQFKHKYSS